MLAHISPSIENIAEGIKEQAFSGKKCALRGFFPLFSLFFVDKDKKMTNIPTLPG